MTPSLPAPTREQILARRRAAGGLTRRQPIDRDALADAATAGLQDSMPRAAVLSLHARIEGIAADTWADPTFVQIWGPRYSVFAVGADDWAPFTLGRLPLDERGARRAHDTADRLEGALAGEEQRFGEAARTLGVGHNSLRYATTTGRFLLRWDGARQPTVRAVPSPSVDPDEARAELVRRFLHIYGPSTPDGYRSWAGVGSRMARSQFERLRSELTPVASSIGEAWILTDDLDPLMGAERDDEGVRLLPSGDAYYLWKGEDRRLLVPDAGSRSLLWTSRVWPGAILARGEIVGTWRRSRRRVTLEPWGLLDPGTRTAIEAEALGLPLPPSDGEPTVQWID